MKNIEKILLFISIFITVFLYCFSASAATNIDKDIDSSTTWTKADGPYIIKKYIYVNSPLTIEPGTIIKFDYHTGAKLNIKSELNAVGTNDDKIIFTSIRDDSFGGDTNGDGDSTTPSPGDWSYIQFYSGSKATLEHTSIFYGSPNGIVGGSIQIGSDNVIIKNSEIKYSGYSGFFIGNSAPIIESSIISNNNIGILVSNTNGKIARIKNSLIANNNAGAGAMSQLIMDQLDARDNWWGDKTGPYFKPYLYDLPSNLDGKGNAVTNGVIFDPWLQKAPKFSRMPVILVPGIGASFNPDIMISGLAEDNWTMFDHTYDGIIESFKSLGYVEGEDLFIAYYDWRKSNAESANNFLKPIIRKALTINSVSKVNVVAHSMGGLVARSYVESDNYANDIDNLILIATPNRGSSDVYAAWEGGYVPKNWNNKLLIKGYLGMLLVKNPTMDRYLIIHNYVPSVGELMPVYDYIKSGNSLLNYISMNEKNNFLTDLNSKESVLNNRVKVSVIKGTGQETVNSVPVLAWDGEMHLWKDGKPEPIDPEPNDSNGDGRVLESSAQIQNIFNQTLSYDHGDIVSASEKIIAERLGENLDTIYPAPDVYDEMGFWFASPVDVQIKDPNGNTISKDTNNIPLAKYSGESKPDGFKMVVIPNPIAGDYEVNIKGNGDGEYHIGSEYADYTGEKQDYSSIIQGEIKVGEEKEYKVTYNPGNETPIEDIKPLDSTPPTISAIATTEPNEDGWYNGDVTVHFSAEDVESGVDGDAQKDVIVSTEGKNQSVTETFKDVAGNVGSKTFSGINIDKTAPETEVKINGMQGDNEWYISDVEIEFSVTDELSGADETYFSLNGAQFESGNSVTISNEGEHNLKYYSKDLAGNIEAEKELKFKIDKTFPVVEITSPKDQSYLNNRTLEIKYNVTDTNRTISEIIFDNRIIYISKIDLPLEHLGSHSISVSAKDEAGNVSSKEVEFEVTTNIRAIISNVDYYFDRKLVTSWSTKRFLETKLRNIEGKITLLKIFESKWMPWWAKERLAENLRREINHEINNLISQINSNRNFSKTITLQARELLNESLEFIKK